MKRLFSSRLAILIVGVLYVSLGVVVRAYAVVHLKSVGPIYIWWVVLLIPLTVAIALTKLPWRQAAIMVIASVVIQMLLFSTTLIYYFVWYGWEGAIEFRKGWMFDLWSGYALTWGIINVLIQLAILRVARMQLGQRRLGLQNLNTWP